jgi:hypothetical protein
MEVWIHSFLNLALGRGDASASHTERFKPGVIIIIIIIIIIILIIIISCYQPARLPNSYRISH